MDLLESVESIEPQMYHNKYKISNTAIPMVE